MSVLLGRALALGVLAAAVFVLSWLFSGHAGRAETQLAAAVLKRLEEIHREAPSAQAPLGRLNTDAWTSMYVFPPLTPGRSILIRLGRLAGTEALMDDLRVTSDAALVVLANERAVVRHAYVPRVEIDISCVTAGRAPLTPRDDVEVAPAAREEGAPVVPHAPLVALAERAAATSCLAALPTLRP